jgi:predicted transposase/invertase (TIGR01784 family)
VEKWIYFIKNVGNLTMIPQSATLIPDLNNAYNQASLFSWTKDELDVYEYWRMEETSDRYKMLEEFDKGKIEGKLEGKLEEKLEEKMDVARNLKAADVAVDIIMQATGLSREEIETLH